jgi:hypothetical protein
MRTSFSIFFLCLYQFLKKDSYREKKGREFLHRKTTNINRNRSGSQLIAQLVYQGTAEYYKGE